MKDFFRVLRYSPKLRQRLINFFLFTVLGVIFSSVTLVVAIPLLQILFDNVKATATPPIPAFSFSADYAIGVFQHYFISVINTSGKQSALLFVCVCVVGFRFLGNLFGYIERVVASKLRVEVVRNLRSDFFEKITHLHIGYFNDQRKGDLISRFTNDAQEVENSVVNSLKVVFKEPITIVVSFVILFLISVKLTLFSVFVLPLVGGLLAEIVKRLKRQAKLSQESLGRTVNILDETFGGMRVVKAFNARKYILKKMNEENSYYGKVNLSMAYKNELASPVSELMGVIIISGIMFYGGVLILGGQKELEPEAFLIFLATFAQILQPAKSFSNGITSMQKGIASARRIFSIIDTKSAIQNKPNAIALKQFEHSVEFKNVSFAYDAGLVLKNINLTVQKGKTVALVGPSGGGKSTLVDLVPRFYDPTEGEVRIDGKSITDYDIESLRSHMGIVTQESILFNDTIFNNIAFGMPNVSEEAVINAAKIANAHDFIAQSEKGYQTLIGERGSKLSGGQRQRISIARAVLKNPPILILDEATSALDSESEKLVQEALFNLMKNRTSIVIAHRLSTIKKADEIVVIQKGEIAERGTHDELIRLEGVYRKLSDIQSTDRTSSSTQNA
ncbi:MAG: antibiotic ABC transporter ATP-binding protein [Azospira oryzae]|jgi:subfamily B ATP-binding cassette protein MsbA|nr:MAG: antibiotic ABC transporter ATP-binding protein [Azospira oryzae]